MTDTTVPADGVRERSWPALLGLPTSSVLLMGVRFEVDGRFNPSILHPSWFVANGIADEAEVAEALTENNDSTIVAGSVARWRASGLSFTCSINTLSSTTSDDTRADRPLAIVEGVLNALPHTPVEEVRLECFAHVLLTEGAGPADEAFYFQPSGVVADRIGALGSRPPWDDGGRGWLDTLTWAAVAAHSERQVSVQASPEHPDAVSVGVLDVVALGPSLPKFERDAARAFDAVARATVRSVASDQTEVLGQVARFVLSPPSRGS